MKTNESRLLKMFGRGLLLLLLAVAATASVTAKDGAKKSVRNAQPVRIYKGSVLNKKDKMVSHVDVAVEEGRTNADGVFVTKQPYGTTYAVVCDGHEIYWGTLKADAQNVCRLDNTAQTLLPCGFKNPNVVVNGKYVRGCNLNNYMPEQVTVTYSADTPFSDRVGRIMKKYAVSAQSIMKRGIVFVDFDRKVGFVKSGRKGTYTIQVTDADGNPIKGAHVCIHRTYTDANGSYSVRASEGDMLAVGKRKYKSQCRALGKTPRVDVRMKWNGKWESAENWMFPTGDNAVTRTAVMPKFRNGNLSTFLNWVRYTRHENALSMINNRMNYQSEYQDNMITRRNMVTHWYNHPVRNVQVQFVIDYDGTLTDIEVVKSDNTIIARSIVEALKKSPKWSPGRDANGEAVRVKYKVNFSFWRYLAEDYDKERARTMESESWGDAD